MAYEFLKGKTVYLETVTKLPDYWDNGIPKKGEETITYTAIPNCFDEPLDGDEGQLLPAGVLSRDTKWLYTGYKFKTYTDYDSDASLADKIYLSDPTKGRKKPPAYVVMQSDEFEVNDDFDLISEEHSYIIVREGKL